MNHKKRLYGAVATINIFLIGWNAHHFAPADSFSFPLMLILWLTSIPTGTVLGRAEWKENAV